jgi:hypothetical protein
MLAAQRRVFGFNADGPLAANPFSRQRYAK